MKKTMWKWKAVLTLLLCMIAVGGNWSVCKVQAERIDKATGLRYEIVDDAKITITGYTGEQTTVQIPAKIDGMEVTGIGKEAFWNCDSLTSITIPNSVTSIGEEAFGDCDSLTSITGMSGVTSIGAENKKRRQTCNRKRHINRRGKRRRKYYNSKWCENHRGPCI